MIVAEIPLRLARCRVCGVLFAVDAHTYNSAMEDRGPLSCPIGHRPAVDWGDPQSTELADVNRRLMEELRQAKFDSDQLRRRMAAMPSPTEAATDVKELKRRCELLSHRAERSATGEVLCKFCGKAQLSPYSLRRHLKRVHGDAIAKMPADSFI